MKGSIHIILGGLLLFVIGCNTDYYKKSYTFIDQVWSYDDPRSFNFEIMDTNKVYDMILTIGHTDKFPYQNLYLNTSTTFPSDTTIVQSLSLEMANEAGFWFGACRGSNCELSIPIQSKVHFAEIGGYTLDLDQYTRTDSLFGVKKISLTLKAY